MRRAVSKNQSAGTRRLLKRPVGVPWTPLGVSFCLIATSWYRKQLLKTPRVDRGPPGGEVEENPRQECTPVDPVSPTGTTSHDTFISHNSRSFPISFLTWNPTHCAHRGRGFILCQHQAQSRCCSRQFHALERGSRRASAPRKS